MTNDSFSIRLREARQMMGLSMDKLVERTSGAITKQSISRYEKGIMRPKRDALQAIAKALNISEEYFEGTNLKIDMPMPHTTFKYFGSLGFISIFSLILRMCTVTVFSVWNDGSFHTASYI